MITNDKLIKSAFKARENAYAPYSLFKVGAALLTDSGIIYGGCNIENASYGETVCAERTAFLKAVSEGEKCFKKIAIVGGKDGEKRVFAYPCGACRQVMAEFCDEDFIIVLTDGETVREYTFREILPLSFNSAVL